MDDASDDTTPTAAENPKDRDPEQPEALEQSEPENQDKPESSDTERADDKAESVDAEAQDDTEQSDDVEQSDGTVEASDTDSDKADTIEAPADAATSSDDAEPLDDEPDPTEQTARWAPPVDGESGNANARPAPQYPPDVHPTYGPDSHQQHPGYPAQDADPYAQGSGPYSQTAGPHTQGNFSQGSGPASQGSGPFPQGADPYVYGSGPYAQASYAQGSGPYAQGSDPYAQNAASYPQGSGSYPQGSGPYPSGPMPYPAAPGQPGTAPRSKFAAALAKGATWKAALIPPGIALLGGIIAAIILTVIVASMSDLDSNSDFSSLSEDAGFNVDSLSYALPFILVALALLGSAVLRLDIHATDSFDAQLNLFISGAPLIITIIVVGLLWWLTKRSEHRSPSPNKVTTWVRIGIATLAMTIVLFLLQVIFAARFSTFEEEGALSFSFSAITVRSFFLPLLVILVTSIAGRIAGHFKGTEAIGAPFLRWAVPPLLVTWIHLAVCVALFSIVALFVLPLSMDVPGQLVPLTFINMGLVLTSLTHLGGISASAQGDFGVYSDSFSEHLTLFSRDTPGQLWLGLFVVVLAVLITTIVATVTRRPSWTVVEQDKQQWASAWKLPVAFCLTWGLLSLVAIPMRMSMSGSAEAAMFFGGSGAARAGIGPLAWTFLIFAVWGGLIEVLSRTLGPRLALTFPAIARIAAGRTVHPHWGPHLGMSEPQFAFIHPDLARTSAQTAPPTAPAPGQFGAPDQPGPQGQQASQPPYPAAGSNPPSAGFPSAPQQPPAPPGAQPGAQAYSAPVGPELHPTPPDQQPLAYPQGSNGAQQYAFSQGSGPAQAGSGPAQPGYGTQSGYGAQPGFEGQGSYGTQPYAVPAQPFDKKKATLVSVVAGGAVLLLVAALIVVTQVNGHMFGPEATAEKYFSELSDGDAEGALKIADVDVPEESRTLLTNDILGGAKALPDDVTVDDAEVSGNTATVAVSYDIGGSKSSSTLTLHKAGKKALFFDDWALKSPDLPTLAVDTPGLTTVKVNGIDVDTDGSTLALPAFPGLYTVGLAEKSDLITADPVEARAFLGDDSSAEGEDVPLLAAQPSDAFRTEVDKQVKTLIDSCAKKNVAQPDGCPFGSSLAESYDASGLKWSISSYPTVTVADDALGSDPYSDPESATGPNGGPAWLISSDTTGEALVTGDYEMFDETESFDDTVSISLSGTAEIVDGKVVITVSDDPWDW